MTIRRQLVDWKGLKALGWTYSRAHTWRLMSDGWEHTTSGAWVVNTDPFPRCVKLGHTVNGHPVWQMSELIKYFEAHGLTIDEAMMTS